MRKKVFLLSFLTVVGLGIITVFVYFQTGRISQVIQHDSAASVDLSLFSEELIDGVNSARFNLAAAYISQSEENLEALQAKALKDFEVAHLALSKLHKFDETDVGAQVLGYADGDQEQKLPLKEIVADLEKKIKPIESSAMALFVARLQNVKDSKELAKLKKDLSMLYRSSGDLKKIDSELYSQLSRALVTALSSQSTRDLQFAGRKILDDTKADYAKLKLKKTDQESLAKLIELGEKTLDKATLVYASSDDFDIFNKELEKLIVEVEAIKEYSIAAMEQTQQTMLATAGTTRSTAVWTSVLVAIVCLMIGFAISKNLIKSLTDIVQNLSKAGGQVSTASTALEETSSALSEGAQKSSASLEETSASLTEISSMISTNAQNAETCAKVGRTTIDLAANGQKEVTSLIQAMKSLAERSKKIEEISVIIEDIAFQTNLLALNAAVEAARAGEHGKGFAVVADAVRSLAHRSAESAKTISSLIHESVAATQQGTLVADKSDEALKKIFSSVTELSTLSESISEACKQQSHGISQIQIAIQELERVSQTNADSASETTESSGTLSAQAQNLNDLVKDLESLMNGTQGTGDGVFSDSAETLPFKKAA